MFDEFVTCLEESLLFNESWARKKWQCMHQDFIITSSQIFYFMTVLDIV